MAVKIPMQGYLVAVHGGEYIAAFPLRKGAFQAAIDTARKFANAMGRTMDLVQVGRRGEDRFIIDEIHPERLK